MKRFQASTAVVHTFPLLECYVAQAGSVSNILGQLSDPSSSNSKTNHFDCLNLDDGTNRLFQNFDNQLSVCAT
jgi:hypothetical protein